MTDEDAENTRREEGRGKRKGKEKGRKEEGYTYLNLTKGH